MAQSHSVILIHLIYSTKHREPLITPEIEPKLYSYQTKIFQSMESPILAINGTEDHVHTLFRLSRKHALKDILEEVKSESSRWMKTQGEEFRHFYRQAGYGAFSIGESGVEAVKKYLANQIEHHKKQTFQDELRLFFQKYHVDYDERYVWE